MPTAKPSGPLAPRHVPTLAPQADRSPREGATSQADHAVSDAAQAYESGASQTSPEGGDWLGELDRKPR